MTRLVTILVLATLAPWQGKAQSLLLDTGRPAIDAYLQQAVERTYIPGLVALVTDKDGVSYSGAFGQQDVAQNRPMTADTIFRIASMTKPITSVAVMMLIEEGKITLDDPISIYIPEMGAKDVFETFNPDDKSFTTRPASGDVTVRHLLTHTSGLGYAFSNEILFQILGSEGLSSNTADYPLLHDPGIRWTYGQNTRVLGSLVETVSGQPLDVFLQDRILGPLGMIDTAYFVRNEDRNRVATVHSMAGQALIESPNPEADIRAGVRGDGGLFSTASDYAKFIRMFLNGGLGPDGVRLLSDESIGLMGQNHIGDLRVQRQPAADSSRSRPFPLGAGRDRFGLGFQITGSHDDSEARSAGSLGWAGIYNTEFWIDPEKGLGGVILMQYLPFYDDTAIDTLIGFEQSVYRHLE